MDELDWQSHRFEEHRTHLRAVAYRMLGSATEADDATQEAWLRLSRADTSAVDNLRTCRARGSQTGVGSDERFGLRRDRFEVVTQRTREVRSRQRLPAGEPTRNPFGKRPIDRVVTDRVGRRLRDGHRASVRHAVMRTGDPGAWGG